MDKALERTLTLWLKERQHYAGFWIKYTALCSIAAGILVVIQAAIIAQLLHAYLMEGAPVAIPFEQLGVLGILCVLRGTCVWLREHCAHHAGARVRSELRSRLLDGIQKMGPVWCQGKQPGQWGNLLFEHIEHLQDYFGKYLPQRIAVVFIPLTILVVVFPINWLSACIFLLTLPLLPLFMVLVGKQAASASQRNFTALNHLSGYFFDRLKGLLTLQHYQQAQQQTSEIKHACESFRLRTMEVLRLAFLSSAVLEFFTAISIALIAVYFGFSYLGQLDFGHYGLPVTLFSGLFVLLLAPEFYAPLRELGSFYHAKAQAIGAAEHIAKLLDDIDKYTPKRYSAQQISLDTIAITAKNLTVTSQDGQRLLGPLTFSVHAGERIALMGRSGSGKSTFLKTLMGFHTYQGELKINGCELTQLDRHQWLATLGVLNQEPTLIHASLRENITLGHHYEDALVIKALEKAQAWAFVKDRGFDSAIRDNSQGLSVGQAQRLCLTRILLKPHTLLLLDEPTANLDQQTAQKVEKTLKDISAVCTTFWVTHQPPQAQSCDFIWIFENGEITQKYTHDAFSESLQHAHTRPYA